MEREYRHKYRDKILEIMRKGEVTVSTFTKLKKNPIAESTARRELKDLKVKGCIDKREVEKGRTEYYYLPGYEKGEPAIGERVIIRRDITLMQYYTRLGWLYIKDITEPSIKRESTGSGAEKVGESKQVNTRIAGTEYRTLLEKVGESKQEPAHDVLMEYTGKPIRHKEVKKRIWDAIKRLKSYGKRGATLNEIATESGVDIELVKKYVWPIAKRLNFAIYEREKKLWEE